jgi:hypothetical protein
MFVGGGSGSSTNGSRIRAMRSVTPRNSSRSESSIVKRASRA